MSAPSTTADAGTICQAFPASSAVNPGGIAPPGCGRTKRATPAHTDRLASVTRIGWIRPTATSAPFAAPVAAPISRMSPDHARTLPAESCMCTAGSVLAWSGLILHVHGGQAVAEADDRADREV